MSSIFRSSQDDFGWMLRPRPMVARLLIFNLAAYLTAMVILWSGSFNVSKWCIHVFELDIATIAQGFVWQFFTYTLLPGGPLFFVLSLLVLWIFGNEVEYELGPKRLFQIYVLGAIAGGVLWWALNLILGNVLHFQQFAPISGIWAAVNAIIFAFIALDPDRSLTLIFFILPVTMLARYLALVLIAISLVFLLFDSNQLASLGGMALGFFFIKTLKDSWKFPAFQLQSPFGVRKPALKVLKKDVSVSVARGEEDYMTQKIDPILDKIAEHGINSLTSKERRMLEDAKDRLP